MKKTKNFNSPSTQLGVNSSTNTAKSRSALTVSSRDFSTIKQIFKTYLETFVQSKPDFTKKELRAYITTSTNIDNNTFDLLFDQFYTSKAFKTVGSNNEKHKIYNLINTTVHHSQTTNTDIPIPEMNHQHAKNALLKKYGDISISEILNYPEGEAYKLLVQTFRGLFIKKVTNSINSVVEGSLNDMFK